jgi:hypothetical protein
MRWLFVVGASLDLGGAILVVWAFLRRTPESLADETAPRFGLSMSALRAQSEEQMYAQSGVALLFAGFFCQLAGYVSRFHSAGVGLAIVVAVAVFAVSVFAGWQVATRRARSFADRAETAAHELAGE